MTVSRSVVSLTYVLGNGSVGVERQWSHAPGELGRWHGGGVVGLGMRGSLPGPQSGPMTILLTMRRGSRRASGWGNTVEKNDGQNEGLSRRR